MVTEIIKEAEQKMKSSIDHLFHELGKLRTGQASVALLDDLMVDYYGNPTPLKQVATLGSPDSHTLTVQPWEATILNLSIPPLTNERRQQLVKLVKKQSEECKVSIRNVRRDINEKLKQSEKKNDISEDEGRKGHDETQKITDKFVAEVDKIIEAKEKDILEV